MSAVLLWCALVLGSRISASVISRNGAVGTPVTGNRTLQSDENGIIIHKGNRRIVVEEVDKYGNSVVKELELPDYDENELGQEKKIKIKQRGEKRGDSRKKDLYGCDNRRGIQRKKCLQRQKKFIKGRYKNWKALIRQIIKDLDGKIKTIGQNDRRQSRVGNLNFLSELSPKNVMKEKK